jgi:hypothetical protein
VSSPESRAWARRNAQTVGLRRCDACSHSFLSSDLEHVPQAGWCCARCRAVSGGHALAALLTWVQCIVNMEAAIQGGPAVTYTERDATVRAVIAAYRDLYLIAARRGVDLTTPGATEVAVRARFSGMTPLFMAGGAASSIAGTPATFVPDRDRDHAVGSLPCAVAPSPRGPGQAHPPLEVIHAAR